MTSRRSPYLYALSAVLFWSTAATAFKITLRYLDVRSMLLFSSLSSTAALGVIVLAQGKARIAVPRSLRDILRSLAAGLLNPCLYYAVLFEAYSLLPAQQAMTLNYTWPLMLALLSSPLLGQRITAGQVAAMAVSFAGVVTIATGGDFTALRFSNLPGVSLALGSSVVWALFWIVNLRDPRDEVVKLFTGFAAGSAVLLAVAISFAPVSAPRLPGLAGSVYIGLFEMGIAFVLWLRALAGAETTAHVGNLVYLSPFFSLILIGLVVGEAVELSTVAGLALIVAGIALQKRAAGKPGDRIGER